MVRMFEHFSNNRKINDLALKVGRCIALFGKIKGMSPDFSVSAVMHLQELDG